MTNQPYLWRSDTGPLVDRREALRHLREDRVLRAVIDQVGPPDLERPPERTTFEFLLRAIVYQQLSGAAASTILGRVRQTFRPGRLTPAALLATGPMALRAAGLSTGKTRAAMDLANVAARRQLPTERQLRRLTPAQAIERLTDIRGVGPWTVQMLLIFYLGHPDILPALDLGIRKGFARVYRRRPLPGPAVLARHAVRWQPYRSVASWYLWRALELPPG